MNCYNFTCQITSRKPKSPKGFTLSKHLIFIDLLGVDSYVIYQMESLQGIE